MLRKIKEDTGQHFPFRITCRMQAAAVFAEHKRTK
jgi:hypothetical protein